MELTLVYCSVWNYEPQAVGLVTVLAETFKRKLSRIVMVPSDGGKFEVTLGSELLYSKQKTGEFPKVDDIVAAVRSRLPARR